MSTTARANSRQEGAVVIVMSLFLVVVVGVLALVVDLGHLYSTKTGLQNAADAAALAGARELNGRASGIQAAVNKAVELARQNRYDFYQPVGTAAADGGLHIQVGQSPDDMIDADLVDTDTEAANKTFVRVSTGSRSVGTWFAGIWGISATSTYAVAVAGQASSEVALVAVCARQGDPANPRDDEWGYERGVSYKVSESNPLAPGTLYWIDPASGPDDCAGNTTASLPYACAGKIPFVVPVGQNVYTNTGVSDPLLEALDARFDVYSSKNRCDPQHAPPDRNIREYRFDAAGAGTAAQWIEPDPSRQSLAFVPQGGQNLPKLLATRVFADYGVLWSYSRQPGASPDDWPTLYGGAASGYPAPSPYAQSSGAYFTPPRPANQPGKPLRRLMNVAMVDCSASAGGSCRPLRVLAYGRFFMQRKANVPGDKDIYLEFDGLLPDSFPAGEVRLYR